MESKMLHAAGLNTNADIKPELNNYLMAEGIDEGKTTKAKRHNG